MTVRAALYIRGSTGGQELDTQELGLRSFAEAHGWSIVGTYRETVSGTGRKPRPEFDKLREAVRAHSVDVVLVTKLDRIARSVRDALEFFAEAEANGVRVVVATQDIDTGTPVGHLTRTILAAMAEFEAELIRDRTRAAMATIKAGTKQTRSGKPPGRPRKVTPEAVERAVALWRMKRSWADIAQAINLRAEAIRRAVWASKRRPVGVVNARTGERADSSGRDRAGA
jgi:DNA invertase Pin-like site-specific DNA recombinase